MGQRGRLDIAPHRPDAQPLHVLRLDVSRNAVVVGPRESLLRTRLVSRDCSWVAPHPPPAGSMCTVQLRAHGSAHHASVASVSGSDVVLHFDPPVAQVSPGQSAVLYRGDEVLGGGTVAEAS